MKKKIGIFTIILFLFCSTVFASSINGEYKGNSVVKVLSNGVEVVAADTPAMVIGNRTLVPLYLLKKMGVSVDWNQENYSVNVKIPDGSPKLGISQVSDELVKKNFISNYEIENYGDGNFIAKTTYYDSNGDGFVKSLSKLKEMLHTLAKTGAQYVEVFYNYKGANIDQNPSGEIQVLSQIINNYFDGKINDDELSKNWSLNGFNASVSASGSQKQKLNVSDIAKLSNRVGIIYTYDQFNNPIAQGSGFMIEPYGLVVTNHHVINGASYETVKIDGQTYKTHFYTFDNSTTDLYGAAINTDDQGKYKNDIPFPYLKLSTTLPQVGDKVYAVGSPKELENTVSEGIVSGIRNVNGVTMIQHTANTDHGSSGGVLLNEYGEVIGVTSSGYDGTSLDFAIASSYVQSELDKLK